MTSKPNDVRVSRELLPCPFCGTVPTLPDGDGTQYEIECDECGQASSSVQICDLMTIEERATDEFKNYRYGEEFIERAKLEAIKKWNTRAQPADQQDDDIPADADGYPDDPPGTLYGSADQQGEPAAWANGEQLLLCSLSRLNVGHPNQAYRNTPRNVAGSALKTEYCDTPLYRHAQPATAKVDGDALEKLKELVSAVRSINRSAKHEVRVIDDDEPCYAQRKEWVEWLLSICDDADEVAKLNTPQ